MDLSHFVSLTLMQIADGVSIAQKNLGGRIAPELIADHLTSDRVMPTRGEFGPAYLVTFDVAITASEKSTTGGEGGIQVLSILSAKGGKSEVAEHSSVSRVHFDVPIAYGRATQPGIPYQTNPAFD
jgi:hypothetical protein